jgi:hypothetical protein
MKITGINSDKTNNIKNLDLVIYPKFYTGIDSFAQ